MGGIVDSKPTSKFIQALLRLDRICIEKMLVSEFEHSGLDGMARTLIAPALEQIGDQWTEGQVSLSEVYMSSKLCEDVVLKLKVPETVLRRQQPKIAIAALLDFHLLGKKIVQQVLRSAGYQLIDYGQGLSVDRLTEKVIQDRPNILLISTLMLPSALKIKLLREKLNQAGISQTKIVVGGAPFRFDLNLWREVGADASGISASDALSLVERLSYPKCPSGDDHESSHLKTPFKS